MDFYPGKTSVFAVTFAIIIYPTFDKQHSNAINKLLRSSYKIDEGVSLECHMQ